MLVGGGMNTRNDSRPTRTDRTFSNRSASPDGGVLHNDDSSSNLIGGTFTGKVPCGATGGFGTASEPSAAGELTATVGSMPMTTSHCETGSV